MFTKAELKALGAAISQFEDMIEGGSEDERHEVYHGDLKNLLAKIKRFKSSNVLFATDLQICAIREQLDDCTAMIGGADDETDTIWRKRIQAANRMFKKNNLPIVEIG